MKKPYLLAATLVAAALVAWLSYPWTKSQCVSQAAQMPTEAGVRAKFAQCNRDFVNE